MPHGGPPPPHDFMQGPFEDVPIMDVPVNNGWDDDINDLFPSGNNKNSNNKNGKNGKKQQIEMYECYILERVKPAAGERWTWSKVLPRRLHFQEEVFIDMAKKNRKKTGRTDIHDQFKVLSQNQQKVVTQLVEDRKRQESLRNADWALFDIYRIERKSVLSREVTGVQVILQRYDTNQPKGNSAKDGKKGNGEGKSSPYKHPDVIDVNADPGKKKGNKDKNGNKKAPKKHKSYDDLLDPMETLGLGLGPDPMQGGHQRNNSYGAQHQDYFNPHPPPPPNAFPMGHMPPPPPPPMQPPFNNPFAPMSHVPMAGDYNLPPHPDDNNWPHPHRPSARVHPNSFHEERRPSTRRKSFANDDHYRQIEDFREEMNFRMHNMHPDGDSGESFYDDDPEGVWSRPLSPTRSFTPPSSPRSQFSNARQRQSLDRHRSGRYRKKYRAGSFVEIEPGYSSGRRRSSAMRPRANTFEDYPDGGRGYVRAPDPPRIIQRRLTDYPEAYDGHRDRDREFDRGDDYHRRRGSRYGEDLMYEQGGRRRGSRGYYG